MFMTNAKLTKLIQAALEAQYAFEKQHREPYDREQRVEAVTQRVEQMCSKKPPRHLVISVLE
jgi:hypothetical protein